MLLFKIFISIKKFKEEYILKNAVQVFMCFWGQRGECVWKD